MKRAIVPIAVFLFVLLLAFSVSAVTASVGSDDSFSDSGSGQTSVKAISDMSAISVTVPISVTFVAPAQGGTSTYPSQSAYKITNSSSVPVYVSSIVVSTATDSSVSPVPTISSSAQSANSSNKNVFFVSATAATQTLTLGTTAVTPTAWNVSSGESLPITLSGSNSPLSFYGSNGVHVFDITYTIAIGISE